MQKLASLLIAVCLLAAACGSSEPGVKGSGHVVRRQLSLSSFSELDVEQAFRVRLATGAPQKVVVRVDDNLADHLDVGVSGSTLHVRLKDVSVSKATLQAEVSVPSLAKVSLSEASEIDGQIAVASPLELDLGGASRADLAGTAKTMTVKVGGSSELGARDLTVGSLTIDLDGSSTAEITVTDELSAGLNGSSSLRYHGSPRVTRAETHGASTITRD